MLRHTLRIGSRGTASGIFENALQGPMGRGTVNHVVGIRNLLCRGIHFGHLDTGHSAHASQNAVAPPLCRMRQEFEFAILKSAELAVQDLMRLPSLASIAKTDASLAWAAGGARFCLKANPTRFIQAWRSFKKDPTSQETPGHEREPNKGPSSGRRNNVARTRLVSVILHSGMTKIFLTLFTSAWLLPAGL